MLTSLGVLAALVVGASGPVPGAEGLVRDALRAERQGEAGERDRALRLALEREPDHPKARALLGMVRVDGRWQAAEDAAGSPAPGRIREYEARRAAIRPGRAADHLQLAHWCLKHGLADEARAHFGAVIRLDPSSEVARAHLGYRRHKGRWMTPEAIRAEVERAQVQAAADRRWGPELDRLRTRLHRPGGDEEAEAALADVRDPAAVPKLWEVFVLRSPRPDDWARAARALGRIEGPETTARLARLAASCTDDGAATAASEELLRRDPRDAIDVLVGMLRDPIPFAVVPGSTPGSVGELLLEGKAFNIDRFYVLRERYNPLFELDSLQPTRQMARFGPFAVTQVTTPPRVVEDFAAARLDAQAALRRDAARLERLDASVMRANARIDALLRKLTGHVADATEVAGAAPDDPAAALARDRLDRLREVQQERDRAVMMAQATPDPSARMDALARFTALSIQGVAAAEAYREAQAASSRASALATSRGPMLRQRGRNDAWRRWWAEERGYARDEAPADAPRPTYVQVRASDVPVYVIPGETFTDVALAPGPRPLPTSFGRVHNSCFAAGTPVLTRAGRRPIESIQVGDLVLSQDTDTGGLAFRPVVAVHHRKPSATYRLRVGGEDVVATGIHRFWKAGAGWAMARDLKPGDPIRAVGGLRTVESVAPDGVRPVFNLEVDRTPTFFVADAGLLVHDDQAPGPIAPPFDAPDAPGGP